MRITIMGFGDNSQNQLGDNPCSARPGCFIINMPDDVQGVKQLVCGATCSALLDINGTLYIWGKLATDSPESFAYTRPTIMTFFRNNNIQIEQVSCRNMHMAALSQDHRLFVWGDNRKKILPSDLPLVPETSPIEVKLPDSEVPQEVACGGFFTLVLTETGKIYGFGVNGNHVLGDTGICIQAPTSVYQLFFTQRPASRIAAGWSHAAVIGRDGELYTWGREAFGRLGHSHGEEPHQVLFKETGIVGDVACGDANTFVVTTKGPVYSCGWNNNGENGNGDTKAHKRMKKVLLPSNIRVAEIAVGSEQTIVRTTQDEVFVMGKNTNSRIGLGIDMEGSTVPVELPGIRNAISVGSGIGHCLIALTVRGE